MRRRDILRVAGQREREKAYERAPSDSLSEFERESLRDHGRPILSDSKSAALEVAHALNCWWGGAGQPGQVR
jgi:hypothetical protein